MSIDTTTPAAEEPTGTTEADEQPDAPAASGEAATDELNADQDQDADTPTADTDKDQPDSDDDEDQDDGDEPPRLVRKLRAENASLRERAKAAEAAVIGLQQQAADRQITAAGLKPPAVWAVAQLGDVLADDGTIDSSALAAAMSAAKEQLGVAPPRRSMPRPGAGSELRSGAGVPLSKPHGFAAAFAPRPN